MSSVFSGNIKISIFGQSHSQGIGVVMDGLPPGEKIDLDAVAKMMNRRSAVGKNWATPRKEKDLPQILSGLVNGVTCGAPLCAVIMNTNTRSQDYEKLRTLPRPGHADYTAQMKFFGFQDVAGGGHFSGRLTAPLCFAGAVCMEILKKRNIYIGAHILKLGGIRDEAFDPAEVKKEKLLSPGEKVFPVLSQEAGKAMIEKIETIREEGDSIGGVIECGAVGVPEGLGSPMFDGMENRISRILFAVPAVKGVEFGDGFPVSDLKGSENNDAYTVKDGKITAVTNHAGGILGGITNGMPILLRAAFKPTPSIGKTQKTVNMKEMTNEELDIGGRHDPCIVPRAVPCVESCLAIALLDALLERKMDRI